MEGEELWGDDEEACDVLLRTLEAARSMVSNAEAFRASAEAKLQGSIVAYKSTIHSQKQGCSIQLLLDFKLFALFIYTQSLPSEPSLHASEAFLYALSLNGVNTDRPTQWRPSKLQNSFFRDVCLFSDYR